MKKICFILCLCIITWGFASCGTNTEVITMEEFKNYTSIYKEEIESIDESLVINESTLVTQDGNYITVYSIETHDHISFGVTLTLISEKKPNCLLNLAMPARIGARIILLCLQNS